jgi:hypothetical protein
MNSYLPIYIQVSNEIVTDLNLTDKIETISSLKYLKFITEPSDIIIENNYVNNEPGIQASLGRVLINPRPMLRKFTYSFRESRYEFYLALEKIAINSQRAYVNNSPNQLIKMLDYSSPDYDDFVNRVEDSYTTRLGYIPIQDLSKYGNMKKVTFGDAYNEFGNLMSNSKLKFSFYEVNPRF